MKIGSTMFATDYAIRPDTLAKEYEERGLSRFGFPNTPISQLTERARGRLAEACPRNIGIPTICLCL